MDYVTKANGRKPIPTADIPRLVKAAATLRDLAPSQSQQPTPSPQETN